MTKYAIGVDLGGTTIKFAVASSDGDILYTNILPSKANCGAADILSQITLGVREAMVFASEAKISVEGVGIGTPGIVSPDGRCVIGGAENLVGWENIPLADEIANSTQLGCKADNDANLMALGETMFGAARGCSDVLFLTVGTGIGGGILIDGKLYSGHRNRGGEMGHITIKHDGEKCACGSVGCFEHYASTAALVREYSELTGEADVDGKLIVKRYLSGESNAVKVMQSHWKYLASGIASLIHIFSPEKVVVGGGISEAGDFYIRELRGATTPLIIDVCGAHTQIIAAELGNNAGVLGAVALILRS